jgi:protein-tyrosine phosphatase
MPVLLFVCTANLCRSPMAEQLAHTSLPQAGLADWQVTSAGTWTRDGLRPDHLTLQVIRELGGDLSRHRSRLLREADMVSADLVLVMEANQREALQAEFPAHAAKVHLLSALAGQEFDIVDPSGGALDEYRRVAGQLRDLLTYGLEHIPALAQNGDLA